jgi:hypothetical protein
MGNPYHIRIQGLEDPKWFVDTWSSFYSYSNEDKYNLHINTVLEKKESFIQLFQWKNGTGSVISQQKMKTVNGYLAKYDVLKQLRSEFSWTLFENEFQPNKSSTIWKIFLLHLIDPAEFPIYDQHVFRFYNFYRNGVIEEISTNPKIIYSTYKDDYKSWFNSFKKEYQLSPKKMDEAFFSFGQVLKRLMGLPLEILN